MHERADRREQEMHQRNMFMNRKHDKTKEEEQVLELGRQVDIVVIYRQGSDYTVKPVIFNCRKLHFSDNCFCGGCIISSIVNNR